MTWDGVNSKESFKKLKQKVEIFIMSNSNNSNNINNLVDYLCK